MVYKVKYLTHFNKKSFFIIEIKCNRYKNTANPSM